MEQEAGKSISDEDHQLDQYLIGLLQDKEIDEERVQGILEKLKILRRMHDELHKVIQSITPCPAIIKVNHSAPSDG